ncbi:hypothetical protein TNCV_14921 [Trichonephila clavipes]|nr:hypothetical protein TNCV_14921 [Trichonephila clavipes]
MTCRKGPSTDEIANLLRDFSKSESDSDDLSCSYLDFDEDLKLTESDCEKSDESADVIDKIPVNPNIYVSRNDTKWIPHNNNFLGRFAT